MLSDRISRITAINSSDMGYRSDLSSKTNLRKIGRMYTSPSLERVNSFDNPRNVSLSRHKSIYDLSDTYVVSNSTDRIASPITHRNPTFQRMRNNVWQQSETRHALNKASIPRSRTTLSFNSATHSSTLPQYMDPLHVLDRRDILISQLNAMSSPTVGRRVKPYLSNRSNVTTKSHHWPISTISKTSSNDNWRARLRERPLLSNLLPTMQSRAKSPILSSGLNSRTSSTSSAKFDETVGPEKRDSSSGIYRNRYMIKFREHNLGQTASQRRSSITWDLPKSFSGTRIAEELPICEHSEPNQELDSKDAESSDSNLENGLKGSVCKARDSAVSDIDIRNEEMRGDLKSELSLVEKSVAERVDSKYNGSRVVIDILAIHTASAMPEPSGAPVALLQPKAASLKSKEQTVKTVDKKKSPKKKKVKKKDVLKDKVKAEPKRLQNNIQKESCVETQTVLPKVETKVCKDLNQNILDKFDLNQNKVLDLTPKRIKFRKYTFDDFNLLKVLGRGSFGKVFLAELKEHNVCFAIKCLKKHSVIEDDDIESIMIERKVLAYGSSHPFICKLFCTFQSESYLCFAMEWCCGGDLMFHVQKSGKFDEDKARFYASEILCAVQFMHRKGIVYRDLKLDNIMVDKEGHLRLVDFGMCQGRIYREDLLPSNFCGTPEYMAPEIIKGVKYNQSVDFWSLGVLLYEMVVGTSPFHGTDEDELLWNVCYEEVNYPRYLSENIKSLLVLLLSKSSEERLGMPGCPAGDIYVQPFFKSVEWVKVERCQIKPPFVPELSSPSDVCYFDLYFTKEEPNLTPVSDEITLSMDQTVFKGFSYTNHNMTD